jgi:hypothetical protein
MLLTLPNEVRSKDRRFTGRGTARPARPALYQLKYRVRVLPLAVSGRIVIAVVVVGAIALVAVLLRIER